MRRMILRLATVAALMVAGVALLAGSAYATHTHVKETGRDGACVVLAANGAEDEVDLPVAAFNNTTVSPTPDRNHPIHVLVHKGRAGQNFGIYVQGSGEDLANCSSYVNG